MVGNVFFESTAHGMKESLEAIDLFLELAAIANSKARLLPFLVDACSIVTRTPSTGWFDAVAFDLSRLA